MARGWLTLRISPPQPDEALGQLRIARERLLEVGTALDVANCDTEIARARLLMGAPGEAVQVALGALARMREGDRLDRARTRVVIAAAQLALGNDAAANQAYEGAAADLARAGANRQAASAWLELAEICEAMGRSAEALAAYRKASAAAGLRAAPAMPLVPAMPFADATVGDSSEQAADDAAHADHYVEASSARDRD
jgi:tetratricopeptide (TPR) repeat protein